MTTVNRAVPHKNYIQRLYKRALKSAFDHHAYERDIFRQHCLKIRSRFEENRNEQNPVRIEALVRSFEKELELNAHVRPFKYPTQIGGNKFGRNEVPSLWLTKYGKGNWVDDKVEFEKI
ncbi:hypothetical protein MIR68_006662 [Amoeboaphelidium protococcarum]|nr:hypothetical protein MIR68_006662 [Amoeboaphelidium protococcarum]